ncbi:TIGR03503 family protein [Shewanella psychropiezotolerans]|uniref:TIGR03503 family protein n=1 Tax=Shewanella psychropiezotolerans TaxID=2593655 RepID=A0ABX5X1Q0_9GAMM|nr:TIGR03503 family protein [Shewanella psychropiezotolerans]QDO84382.1 TIGR03503 family protein [Shewanella psychropiezotolerans]
MSVKHFVSRKKALVALIMMLGTVFSTSVLANVVPSSEASVLKNRFRIDHMVDSLTLFIQRQYGSSPVVIVLPDGSKWYASRHPKEVQWVDGLSGDIVTIHKPMPGPWQLIGRVVEGSKIQKISKLGIKVENLPQPLFQGERVKVTAQLLGDEQRLRMPGLDYLVEWTARFISDHLPGDENFAAGILVVGSYKDYGEDLDERPDDGVFTGKINLNQPWGHYTFQVKVRNKVFSRESLFKFMLSPIPIEIEILEPEDPLEGRWKLFVKVDEAVVQLSETHLDLELVGPAGLQLPITLSGLESSQSEIILPEVSDFGSYRIKGMAATTTLGGREIVLALPERFFNLIEPPKPPPTAEELAARAAKKAAIEETKAKDDAIFWIITVNVTLLVLGTLGLLIWRKRRNLKEALAATQKRLDEEKEKDLGPSLDEIDLTMPEDPPVEGKG